MLRRRGFLSMKTGVEHSAESKIDERDERANGNEREEREERGRGRGGGSTWDSFCFSLVGPTDRLNSGKTHKKHKKIEITVGSLRR
jgi:hypothetical protein